MMPSYGRSRAVAVCLAALAVAVAARGVRSTEKRAGAQQALSLPAATIAIVATPHDPGARSSEVRLVTVDGAGMRATALGTIAHAPQAVVRGDVLRVQGGVAVAADEDGAPDRDWGSALFRVDAGGVKLLARGLYHASRPLASSDGAVYVERGARGRLPSPEDVKRGALRTDALAIDAIDPATGAARTVTTALGYTMHLCGELGSELVVYFVDFGHARILGVDRASGSARTIADVPPFARDFSIDARRGALVMSNRDAGDASLWTVESLDLASGAITRLYAQKDEAPAPFVLPDGTVGWTSDRKGLAVAARRLAPFGPGFDAVTSTDGAWITIDHVSSSGFDTFAAVHVASGVAQRVTAGDERVTVLGFLGAPNGGAR